MPYNALWGVGREPRTAGTPYISNNAGSWNAPAGGAYSTTATATLTSQTYISHILVRISIRNAVQTATNPRIQVFLNENNIANYSLTPQQAGTADDVCFLNDILPFPYYVIGDAILRVTFSCDAAGATAYQGSWSIDAVGIYV